MTEKTDYLGVMKHDWEAVAEDEQTITYRLRVPGGWLYRNRRDGRQESICFVPEPRSY